MNLTGKVALVTGASRGIGRAIALDLARKGADVVINYAGNAALAEEVVGMIQEMDRKSMAIQADVANREQVEAMIATTIKEFGALHILVNNAGITRDQLILRMKEEDWDRVLDTNLKGAFHTIKAVTRQMMKQREGRIINISSVVGVAGNAGQINYSASKAGLIGLTKTAARELAARNITVNAVAPGYIESDMTDQLSDEIKNELFKQIPLGRLGKPEDVSALVTFLASDAASYITGQVFHVNGGMYM
ncbi:MAG: 3-oxoacyl-[acyl-carrier-protein] reductase [Caldibacillus sp.]